MLKEHKEKIEDAIKECNSVLSLINAKLTEIYGKEEAAKRFYFISENTYFAGGMFRSIFTSSKINDYDIFFNSLDAVLEFKHMFFLDGKWFNESNITKNGNISLVLKKNFPKVSFNTVVSDVPEKLLNTFDFSFNKHYFCPLSYKMRFDIDTFKKIGSLTSYGPDKVGLFYRLIKFYEQGFKIKFSKESFLSGLISEFTKEVPEKFSSKSLHSSEEHIFENVAATGEYYTDFDYFTKESESKKKQGWHKLNFVDEVFRDIPLAVRPHPEFRGVGTTTSLILDDDVEAEGEITPSWWTTRIPTN